MFGWAINIYEHWSKPSISGRYFLWAAWHALPFYVVSGLANSCEDLLTYGLFSLFIDFLNFDLEIGNNRHVLVSHLLDHSILTTNYLLVGWVPNAIWPPRNFWIERVPMLKIFIGWGKSDLLFFIVSVLQKTYFKTWLLYWMLWN